MKKYYNKKYKKKYKPKKYKKIVIVGIMLVFAVVFIELSKKGETKKEEVEAFSETAIQNNEVLEKENDGFEEIVDINAPSEKIIDDWRLILANKDNTLPDDFNVELSNIDKIR